jgi:hypothetical protein
MRPRGSFFCVTPLLGILGVVALGCGVAEPGSDVCARASAHLQECVPALKLKPSPACSSESEAQADQVLQMNCQQLGQMAFVSGKADQAWCSTYLQCDGENPRDTTPRQPEPDEQSCASPRAFEPPSPPSGWKHTSTVLVTLTQGTPNHRGQDVVVAEGKPQVLIGKFAYGLLDMDLENEEVEIFIQESPPCGAWVSLGTAETSDDGHYGTGYGIEDDGGRIFFTVPQQRTRPVGRYPVRMLVKGDNSVAAFTLFVLPEKTDAVVFDIDGTLTTSDSELYLQVIDQLLSGDYVPEMRPGASSMAQAWAEKGYLPVYLTGRQDLLRHLSQGWLEEMGFPPGVIHHTDTNTQALPTSMGVARYKADFLLKLGDNVGAAVFAAYGNATTDIEAYETAGIPKDHTFIVGKNAGKDQTVPLSDYTSHLSTVRSMPPATSPAPPATFGW